MPVSYARHNGDAGKTRVIGDQDVGMCSLTFTTLFEYEQAEGGIALDFTEVLGITNASHVDILSFQFRDTLSTTPMSSQWDAEKQRLKLYINGTAAAVPNEVADDFDLGGKLILVCEVYGRTRKQ